MIIKHRITNVVLYDDINKANLEEADLRGADLRGADLGRANLGGADLRCANLEEANLRGAYLRGADLREADLRGADLRGTSGMVCLGYDPRGYRFVGVKHHDGWWHVLAGCRWFTISEAQLHWANNKDALARVAILDAHT